MKPKNRLKNQTFNDGLLQILYQKDVSQPGEYESRQTVTRYTGLPYEERRVGITRFYQGKQAGVEIDRVIRCPRRDDVYVQDVILDVSSNTHYTIEQVQVVIDLDPPSMDLSLIFRTNPIKIAEEEEPEEEESIIPEVPGGDEDDTG